MSQLDEVTRGLQASLHIVNHYGVNEFTGVLVIDKHDGDFHFRKQRYVQGANAGRGNHNAIHSPLGERMHNLSFTVWVGIGVAEKDRVTVIVTAFFDAVHYLAHEWVGDRGNHHSNRLGPLGDQSAGDGACAITRFLGDALYFLRRPAADEGAAL